MAIKQWKEFKVKAAEELEQAFADLGIKVEIEGSEHSFRVFTFGEGPKAVRVKSEYSVTVERPLPKTVEKYRLKGKVADFLVIDETFDTQDQAYDRKTLFDELTHKADLKITTEDTEVSNDLPF